MSSMSRPQSVVGPVGEALSLEELPPPATSRWTAHRKAEVVAAVNGGLISSDEACDRHDLSIEELTSWLRSVDRLGLRRLRLRMLQRQRRLLERYRER
jgi:hypothetical protein